MHIEIKGRGPDLVMLHGWGMNSAVWGELADNLAKTFTLYLVDLPGHGNSAWQAGDLALDTVLNKLAKHLPKQAYWLGWSLGGLISLAFAHQFGRRVNKLILLSTSPCFVKRDDWQTAIKPALFAQFAYDAVQNEDKLFKRFLLLQTRGDKNSRAISRYLNSQLKTAKKAHPDALLAGLTLLQTLDMRQAFAMLGCPLKIILGERDTLVPKGVIPMLHALQPKASISLIKDASHAPFIAHQVQCQRLITQFIIGRGAGIKVRAGSE